MATTKRKHAAKKPQSYRTYMHHFAWGIVSAILLFCVGGLLIHAQSLESKTASLERQLLASKRPAPKTCKADDRWQPSTTTKENVGGRDFLVHTPVNFKTYEYYPMVLFYPGKGATAEAAQFAYGLDALPAIVVYPYPTMGKDGFWAWQGAPYSSGSDDITFTANILDKLQTDLCIDRTKIYAAGMSNGGGFTSLLSCKLSGKFAAYAVVAGAMYAPTSQCAPEHPVPLISVHGDQDPMVPYDGSSLRNLPAIDSWVASRAKMNGCTSAKTINDGINTVVTVWTGCKDNATVENIRIKGGGHAWGDVANDKLWQFLSRYSL